MNIDIQKIKIDLLWLTDSIDMSIENRARIENGVMALEQLQAENKKLREGQEWVSVENPPTETQIDLNVCVSFQHNRSKKIVVGFTYEGSFNLDDWCFEYENPFVEYYQYLPKPPEGQS